MVNCREEKKAKKLEEKKNILQISQEIEFVQKLADNDSKIRNRAVKKLKKWLEVKTKSGAVFTKEDLMMLWRGLFYCMWNSDKPLVQEELCENIANLIHNILNYEDTMLYVQGFLATLRFEWPHIDNFRLPKYEMLVRRVLRQSLNKLADGDWELASKFGSLLWDGILKPNKVAPAPIGLSFHLCEIYLQEVAKCSARQEITQEPLEALIYPFVQCFAHNETDKRLRDRINESIFGYLIDQSDIGIEQQEKIRAWRSMGCPPIDINDIEQVEADSEDEDLEDDDEEENDVEDEENGVEEDEENGVEDEEDEENGFEEAERVLDPRAGQLDVDLAQLNFDPSSVADTIESFTKLCTNSITKKYVKTAVKRFRDMAKGSHPIPFEAPIKEEDASLLKWKPKKVAKRAAEDLMKFEEELLKDNGKSFKKGKKKVQEVTPEEDEEEEEIEAPPVVTPKQKAKKKAPSPKTDEPPAKKLRRRSSFLSQAAWEITDVNEAPVKSNGHLASSPSNCGNWNVVSVDSVESEKASTPNHADWDKPLQDGEYEFFVAPKKSPKRRSLYKASPESSISFESHSPVHDGKENVRTPQQFVFNDKSGASKDQESPKSSRKKIIITDKDAGTEIVGTIPAKKSPKSVTPMKKARVSMPLNTKTPEVPVTPKAGRQRMLVPALTNSAKKRVSIQLQHNKAQEVHEYVQQLRNSPHTPHDPDRKPVQGLLKGSPVPFKVAIEKFKRNNKFF